MNFNEGPIVAISTSLSSNAALGIVRISGFENLDWLHSLTSGKFKNSLKSRFVHYSRFISSGGEVLDEGLFTYFPAPNSFTGENLVEFSLHGNTLLLDRFVETLSVDFKFKKAKPGEFSYRALKNKKLNLTQIEGLDLVLNASSTFGLNAGLKGLSNELFNQYQNLRSEFLEIKACLELQIDFSEDVGEEEIKQKMAMHLSHFSALINSLFERSRGKIDHLLSPKISLIGATNAGKSTLFNKFLNSERAIVSNIHGTTRDYISEYLTIGGQSFQVIDTAGLRDNPGDIERIGIEQAFKINRESFFKILVLNPFEDSNFQLDQVEFDAVVFTHSDLPDFDTSVQKYLLKFSVPLFKSGPIGPLFKLDFVPIGPVFYSGPIGPADDLLDLILVKFQALTIGDPIIITRHRDVISDIYRLFDEFSMTWLEFQDLAVLSSQCNRLGKPIEELLGIVSSQEVLDHIFENFCIGK